MKRIVSWLIDYYGTELYGAELQLLAEALAGAQAEENSLLNRIWPQWHQHRHLL